MILVILVRAQGCDSTRCRCSLRWVSSNTDLYNTAVIRYPKLFNTGLLERVSRAASFDMSLQVNISSRLFLNDIVLVFRHIVLDKLLGLYLLLGNLDLDEVVTFCAKYLPACICLRELDRYCRQFVLCRQNLVSQVKNMSHLACDRHHLTYTSVQIWSYLVTRHLVVLPRHVIFCLIHRLGGLHQIWVLGCKEIFLLFELEIHVLFQVDGRQGSLRVACCWTFVLLYCRSAVLISQLWRCFRWTIEVELFHLALDVLIKLVSSLKSLKHASYHNGKINDLRLTSNGSLVFVV